MSSERTKHIKSLDNDDLVDMSVKIFSSPECSRCKNLVAFLESNGYIVELLMIDDPENRTDAIMFNVLSVPAILGNDEVLPVDKIFTDHAGDVIDEQRVLEFVKGI
jgi:predicted thioredoxin/glutaredoxin